MALDARPPTFAILTNFDDCYEVGYLCAAVNAAYCKRWGYRFVPCVLSQEEMQSICAGRHYAWAKIALFTWLFTPERSSLAARAVFQDRLGGDAARVALLSSVEYLVWVDGDALAVDHGVALASFVAAERRSKALVVGEDMSWADWLNTGVFFVRADSEWARGLWAEAWDRCDPSFHHAPFWDQSALCQALAQRGEFQPDVLGARATGRSSSEHPWFSWAGGRPSKETEHMRVVDTGSLQFANPLHAHFVLHLCGYTAKHALCLEVLRLGVLRNVRRADLPDGISTAAVLGPLAGPRWQEACCVVGEAVASAPAWPWGWPKVARRGVGGVLLLRVDLAECVGRWSVHGGTEEPAVASAQAPTAWAIASLREKHGEQRLLIDDCAPLRADDRPQEGPVAANTTRVALWQLCDYILGLPPPVHAVLGRLSTRRQWRAARWRPWSCQGDRAKKITPPWELDVASGSKPLDVLDGSGTELRGLNANLAYDAILHLAPPGAELRLHCPSASQDIHFAIWQLEGESEYALFPPRVTLAQGACDAPLFDASQSLVDPWCVGPDLEPSRAVLQAGEVLLLPASWWIASISLSPSLAVWRPWISAPIVDAHKTSRRSLANAIARIQATSQLGIYDTTLPNLVIQAGASTSLGWLKQIMRAGSGSPAGAGLAIFNAVAHVDLLSHDGRGLQSTRFAHNPAPHVFTISMGAPLPFGKRFADVLRSMALSEVALVALQSEARIAGVLVLIVELLAVREPPTRVSVLPEPRLAGGWSWFGDMENWLGSPPGHEPVDQVEEARRREATNRQDMASTAAPLNTTRCCAAAPAVSARSSGKFFGGVGFTTAQGCRRCGWALARGRRKGVRRNVAG